MRELYNLIFSLPPRSFNIVAIIFGLILIDDLDAFEQNALGDFIITIGQVVVTSSSKKFLDDQRDFDMFMQQMRHDVDMLKIRMNEKDNKL